MLAHPTDSLLDSLHSTHSFSEGEVYLCCSGIIRARYSEPEIRGLSHITRALLQRNGKRERPEQRDREGMKWVQASAEDGAQKP